MKDKIEYTAKQFINEINKKIDRVVMDNRVYLTLGDNTRYSANCNFLRGIDYVMQRFKKLGRGVKRVKD